MKKSLALVFWVMLALSGWASAPTRIVVAGIPLYTEVLLALGLQEAIVGVAESPENPEEVQPLPKVGLVWAPNLEAILDLEPDLVLGAPPLLRDRLNALGIPAFSVGGEDMWITSISEVLEGIVELGRVVGLEDKARVLAGALAMEILALEARVLGRERPRAAFFYLYDPASAPYVAGAGTPEDEVIRRAGGLNAFADLEGYPQLNVEEILLRDPEVIFVGTGQKENLFHHSALRNLRAVQAGQIWEVRAADLVSTRVVQVLLLVAQALHPQALAGER